MDKDSLLKKKKIQKYLNCIGSCYGKCIVVFDGYQDGPSRKNHEHLRLTMKSMVSFGVSVNLDNSISDVTQKAFLCNSNNKEYLTGMLVHSFSCDVHSAVQGRRDADSSIGATVLDFACADMDVCLIAANTDLLRMLAYMWNNMIGRKSEGRKNEATENTKSLSLTLKNNRMLEWSLQRYYIRPCIWWV